MTKNYVLASQILRYIYNYTLIMSLTIKYYLKLYLL